MIRKSLFWGLTLVLVVALVSLIIRGRRMEKEEAAQPAEVVRQAPPSPTRVLAPQDLEIVSSTLQLRPDHTAVHAVEIRNHGSVTYTGILLRIDYQDRAGKTIASKTYSRVNFSIPPGLASKMEDIVIKDVPVTAEKAQIQIQHADMLSADSTNLN